jgi:hypothetical protein
MQSEEMTESAGSAAADDGTAIAGHPRADALARLVRTVALTAADERRTRFSDGLDELCAEAELKGDDGKLGGFHVLKALSRAEPPVATGRRVLGLLLARGVALEPPADAAAAAQVAEALAWLAAHTYLDALWALDEELCAGADLLWQALGALVRRADELGAPKGRAEALAAAAALGQSSSAAAASARRDLVATLRDPLLRGVLARASAPAAPVEDELPSGPSIAGEVVPAPLGPVALFFWALSGLIVLRWLARFVLDVLLGCKRPVEVEVAPSGVTARWRIDLLGRTVKSRELVIPISNLARATREARYPRLGLYAGLTALGIGTYVGVSFATEGVRAASPSLIALGAAIFAVGLVCDLVLGSLLPARMGKYRVVFVPRKGRALAVRVTDEAAADRALKTLLARG